MCFMHRNSIRFILFSTFCSCFIILVASLGNHYISFDFFFILFCLLFLFHMLHVLHVRLEDGILLFLFTSNSGTLTPVLIFVPHFCILYLKFFLLLLCSVAMFHIHLLIFSFIFFYFSFVLFLFIAFVKWYCKISANMGGEVMHLTTSTTKQVLFILCVFL